MIDIEDEDGLTLRHLSGEETPEERGDRKPLIDEIHATSCQFSLEVMHSPSGDEEGDDENKGWHVWARVTLPDGRMVEIDIDGPVRAEVIEP